MKKWTQVLKRSAILVLALFCVVVMTCCAEETDDAESVAAIASASIEATAEPSTQATETVTQPTTEETTVPTEESSEPETTETTQDAEDESSEPTEESTEDTTEIQGTDYVLNKNSKKFHYPKCGSVSKMKESNKEFYTGTREDLIAKGYDPCGNCHP